MHSLFEEILANGPVVTDGAWGTQLQARGLGDGESPDPWNLSHPDRVEEVPRAYVEAGSQVVLTNTFRANRIALESAGCADQTEAINRAGVEISRRAADGKARVFASIGPSGKLLLMGEVNEEQLQDVFRQQALALAEGGADALVIETMSDLTEARLAVTAAKTTGLPVVACVVFDSGRDLDRTMMGNTPEQIAEGLTEAGADAVGANCGQGIASYVDICRRLHEATELPIWIKANAGLPEIEGDKIVYRTTADEFASHVSGLVEAGASFLGGCCGTGPDYIAAVRRELGG